MRILLIGADGQLGRALNAACAPAHEVVQAAYETPSVGHLLVDLGDPRTVLAALCEAKPDLVLLAGAFTHVDLCETQRERCRRVNVVGPETVGSWAAGQGARVVFYSTDLVFDGARECCSERDAIHPLNYYAQCKAEAERRLQELLPNGHLILRTAWLYGPDPARKNFALRLVQRLQAEEDVVIPSDQWGTPTYTEDLAQATLHLVERGASGLFHAVGPEYLDRCALARRICDRFGLHPRHLIPRSTQELGQAAPRPLRVRLDCGKLQATGCPPFRNLEDGLKALQAWHVSSRRGSR